MKTFLKGLQWASLPESLFLVVVIIIISSSKIFFWNLNQAMGSLIEMKKFESHFTDEETWTHGSHVAF